MSSFWFSLDGGGIVRNGGNIIACDDCPCDSSLSSSSSEEPPSGGSGSTVTSEYGTCRGGCCNGEGSLQLSTTFNGPFPQTYPNDCFDCETFGNIFDGQTFILEAAYPVYADQPWRCCYSYTIKPYRTDEQWNTLSNARCDCLYSPEYCAGFTLPCYPLSNPSGSLCWYTAIYDVQIFAGITCAFLQTGINEFVPSGYMHVAVLLYWFHGAIPIWQGWTGIVGQADTTSCKPFSVSCDPIRTYDHPFQYGTGGCPFTDPYFGPISIGGIPPTSHNTTGGCRALGPVTVSTV